eukprot:g36336.t1
MTVKESSQEGTAVGRIKAYDADIGENAEITYQIIDGDGMNMFDITTDKATQEGVVLVKKMLDYESKKSYTLKVEAMNSRLDPRFLYLGPYKDTATVRIAVEDVDEPPVFSRPFYMLDVYEDIDVGTIIECKVSTLQDRKLRKCSDVALLISNGISTIDSDVLNLGNQDIEVVWNRDKGKNSL